MVTDIATLDLGPSPDLASRIAVAVMTLPWTHGATEDEHAYRLGDVQEAVAKALSAPVGEIEEIVRRLRWSSLSSRTLYGENAEILEDKAADALRSLSARLAEAERERDVHKRRGDNHWETLRGIRHIAREGGDLERIILWVNDAGRGYVETADKSLAQLADERNAAIARAEKAERELAEIKDASAQWMEDTGSAYAYVSIRDYAAACSERKAAIAERDRLAGLAREAGDMLDGLREEFAALAEGRRSKYKSHNGICAYDNAAALASRLKAEGGETFQAGVDRWIRECFGDAIAYDRTERNFRFLEEALELAQSLGCLVEDADALVTYVFGRPAGEPAQEVGGVMVCLAALCTAAKIDMDGAGQEELRRVWTKIDRIRAKHASKPQGVRSSLPGTAPAEGRANG